MTSLFKNDIKNMNGFVVGEYIAVFLLEDTTYEWCFGVTEAIHPNNTNNTILVSYLIMGRYKKQNVGIP